MPGVLDFNYRGGPGCDHRYSPWSTMRAVRERVSSGETVCAEPKEQRTSLRPSANATCIWIFKHVYCTVCFFCFNDIGSNIKQL